jgi:hypothetical protein
MLHVLCSFFGVLLTFHLGLMLDMLILTIPTAMDLLCSATWDGLYASLVAVI